MQHCNTIASQGDFMAQELVGSSSSSTLWSPQDESSMDSYGGGELSMVQEQQPEESNGGGARKRKSTRGPKNPRKSMKISGYIVYASEMRKVFVEQNPGRTFAEISRMIGDHWRDMDPQQKEQYKERAVEKTRLKLAEMVLEQQQAEQLEQSMQFAQADDIADAAAPPVQKKPRRQSKKQQQVEQQPQQAVAKQFIQMPMQQQPQVASFIVSAQQLQQMPISIMMTPDGQQLLVQPIPNVPNQYRLVGHLQQCSAAFPTPPPTPVMQQQQQQPQQQQPQPQMMHFQHQALEHQPSLVNNNNSASQPSNPHNHHQQMFQPGYPLPAPVKGFELSSPEEMSTLLHDDTNDAPHITNLDQCDKKRISAESACCVVSSSPADSSGKTSPVSSVPSPQSSLVQETSSGYSSNSSTEDYQRAIYTSYIDNSLKPGAKTISNWENNVVPDSTQVDPKLNDWFPNTSHLTQGDQLDQGQVLKQTAIQVGNHMTAALFDLFEMTS